MKNIAAILITIIILTGCVTSSGGLEEVIVKIFNNNVLVQTYTINENQDGFVLPVNVNDNLIGDIKVDVFQGISSETDEDVALFDIYFRKNGFYSRYRHGRDGDTLQIDYSLEFDPVPDSGICGVLFCPMSGPIIGAAPWIMQDTVLIGRLETDDNGRFQIDIPFGEYYLDFNSQGIDPRDNHFLVDSYYKDYYFYYYGVEYKPNIYLYPTAIETLSVSIDFPLGGHVTVSDPAYPIEWHDIVVEPSGMIDGEHEYLFYEAIHPKVFQRQEGWVISGDSLQAFFEENLYSYGFRGREIEDFTEFWIPRLYKGRDYIIYPQAKDILDTVTPINCSLQPDSYLRLTYLIGEFTDASVIPEKPEIPNFSRSGFVLTEWGVSFDDNIVFNITDNK